MNYSRKRLVCKMDNIIWDYIDQQKEILENMLKIYPKLFSNQNLVSRKIERVLIVASGSSLNAGHIVRNMMGKWTNIEIQVENPFYVNHYFNFDHYEKNHSLVIGISQSGSSTGTIESINKAKMKFIPTCSITENKESELSKIADYPFYIDIGKEDVGTKTKGMSASTLLLHLLLLVLSDDRRITEVVQEYKESLSRLPDVIAEAKRWCNKNRDWARSNKFSVIGYGVNSGVAKEATLKILETLLVPVMNYDLEEYMHGPHRTVSENHHLFLIEIGDDGKMLNNKFIDFLSKITDNYLCVTSSDKENSHYFRINAGKYTEGWLETLVFFQVVAIRFPELVGINPSEPVFPTFAKEVGTKSLKPN